MFFKNIKIKIIKFYIYLYITLTIENLKLIFTMSGKEMQRAIVLIFKILRFFFLIFR